MKKKTVIAMLFASAAAIGLSGCGGKKGEETVNQTEMKQEVESDFSTDAETNGDETVTSTEVGTDVETEENSTESIIPDPVMDEVEAYPATLPDDYSKVTYTVEETDTDKLVEDSINEDLDLSAEELHVTDREVKNGDTIFLSFTGTVDGETDDALNSDGETITIGEGDFIDEFESQIAGHKPGENFDVNITFPNDYWQGDMAGKDASFDVTVDYIIEYGDTPELTDAWVKDNTEFNTVEEYTEDKKASITAQQEVFQKTEMEDELITSLVSLSDVSIPEDKLEEEYKKEYASLETEAKDNGYDDVIKYLEDAYGMTKEEHKEDVLSSYKDTVTRASVVEALIKKEGLEVSEDDYVNYLKDEVAPDYGYTDYNEFKEEMSQYGILDYFDDLYREHIAASFLQKMATPIQAGEKNDQFSDEIEIDDGEEFDLSTADVNK